MKRIWTMGMLFLIMAVVMMGCTGTTDPKEAQVVTPEAPAAEAPAAVESTPESAIKEGGVVRYAAFGTAPGLFNPVLQSNSFDVYEMEVMFEGLLRKSMTNELEACLAESFSVSEDKRTLTFKLRENVKWHDGEPFTAEDVKFTFEFICHPDYAGPYSAVAKAISGYDEYFEGKADHVSGIEVIDPNTVSITTKEVDATMTEKICTSILITPKHIWESVPVKQALEQTELLRNPVGTGPFKISKFVPDQYVEMVANDLYWNGRPHVDKYIVQVANPETAQTQIINNEVEMLAVKQMNPDDLDYYKSAGVFVDTISFDAAMNLGVNNSNELLKDKRVRQAFAYAIDREAIVRDILYGYGTVANVPYKPDFWANPEDGLNAYTYNPQKAIELLEEAGWQYKADEKQMYKDGKPVKLSLKYYSGNKQVESIAPFIQQALKEVGVQIDLQISEYSTMLADMKSGDFELYIAAHKNGVAGDMKSQYNSAFTPPNGTNYSRFSNSRVDELSEQGLRLLSTDERKPIYVEIAKILNEELPIVYLYHWHQGMAMNSKLKNVQLTPNSMLGINYQTEKWYFEE
ncbi:ABC transporter substrate-binding protein [Fusibacter sp. 3D3]|uniref:ABC transporter substrate-binding protein n=1 Tax=Fusibacter sp. 3D3 TaxID=1048380 RepID=UPI000853E29E|nr:ABC transporter substrate-binding protein [Fusibacter sp. 3D3]GAU78941.1 oligopeptide ABC transporter periplasmic oligopeptide-binding protein OppA [Fusibacter sp. 3D3]